MGEKTANLTRREVMVKSGLLLSSGAGALSLIEACQSGQTPQAKAKVQLSMWVQDFGPAVDWFKGAAAAYMSQHPEAIVNVQVIPFTDLKTKVVPAIAAGTEADVIWSFNDWFLAYDLSKLFLPLDEYMGGRQALAKMVYPAALDALVTPHNKVYYMPAICGANACTTTVNKDLYAKAGIDYKKLTNWDDLVQAAKELTIAKSGEITRAGLSVANDTTQLLQQWVWQEGGKFYDSEAWKWNFSTPEGEAALQRLYDLFWTHNVTSFNLVTRSNELETFFRGQVTTQFLGGWMVGVSEARDSSFHADAFVTPTLAGAKSNVLYPDQIVVVTLSRRLKNDAAKREQAVNLLRLLFSPSLLFSFTSTYTGTIMTRSVYSDPRIDQTRYGPLSKRLTEGVWPRAQFPRSHIADWTAAKDEVDNALRKIVSVKQALRNIDAILNQQEDAVRRRSGG